MQQSEQDQAPLALGGPEQLMQCCRSLASWKSFQEPLPTDLSPATLDAIEEDVRGQLIPATNAEVVGAIKRLRMHYGEWSQLTEAEEADIWRDWLLDFKAYPRTLLMDACIAWRNSTAKRPPTPGQLKALVQRDFERLRHIENQVSRARRALTDPERTWRS